MALRTIKPTGKNTEVNGEGPEKDDGTSTTKAQLANLSVNDPNPKIAGLAKGGQSKPN